MYLSNLNIRSSIARRLRQGRNILSNEILGPNGSNRFMIPPLIGLTVHERGASRRVCEERDRVTSRLFEAIKANQAQCSGKR